MSVMKELHRWAANMLYGMSFWGQIICFGMLVFACFSSSPHPPVVEFWGRYGISFISVVCFVFISIFQFELRAMAEVPAPLVVGDVDG
mgnify:CR=1 FL=1